MLEEQPVVNFKCPSSPSDTVKCKTAKKKGKERRTENDFAKFKHCSDPSQYWHALNLRENTSLVQLQMTVNLNEQLECVWGGGILKHTCIYKYAQFLFLSVWHWIILWYDPLQTLQPHTQKYIYIYIESHSLLSRWTQMSDQLCNSSLDWLDWWCWHRKKEESVGYERPC